MENNYIVFYGLQSVWSALMRGLVGAYAWKVGVYAWTSRQMGLFAQSSGRRLCVGKDLNSQPGCGRFYVRGTGLKNDPELPFTDARFRILKENLFESRAELWLEML